MLRNLNRGHAELRLLPRGLYIYRSAMGMRFQVIHAAGESHNRILASTAAKSVPADHAAANMFRTIVAAMQVSVFNIFFGKIEGFGGREGWRYAPPLGATSAAPEQWSGTR